MSWSERERRTEKLKGTFLGVYTLGGLMKNGWTFSFSDYGSADEQAMEDEYTLALMMIDVTPEQPEKTD